MLKYNWWHIIKSFISIRWDRYYPKLVIHEKYERYVKWTLRILLIIGIASSLFAFSSWSRSLLFSLLLVGIEQLLERSIYRYTTMYVQPIPDFEYDPAQWSGMGFILPLDQAPGNLASVGCAFVTEEYGLKMFDLLRAWNYYNSEDKNNNICLSFIIENENEYTVYLYPNPEREIVKDFYSKAEEDLKYGKYKKEHHQLLAFYVFCKCFPYGPKSHINAFIKNQPPGKPFFLRVFTYSEEYGIDLIREVAPIVKYHYKLKKR